VHGYPRIDFGGTQEAGLTVVCSALCQGLALSRAARARSGFLVLPLS
jgi:hypothetical protein